MRLRTFLAVAALTCFATTALADLSGEFLDWGTGPMQYLFTKEEAAAWKALPNNEAAKAFIALFWARRDPTPDTPRNEYREQIEARIRYADENLAGKEKFRGAMTDRGKALIVYGQPKRIERSAKPVGTKIADATNEVSEGGTQSWFAWIYEDGPTKEIFNVQRATLRFIDRFDREEFKLERSNIDFPAAQARAVAKTITQPDLKEAPSFKAVEVPAAPVETAPAVVTDLTTGTLKTAVAELKASAKNPYENKAYAAWGEYVTSNGLYFVPVGLYVPKASGITRENLTFFGVVEDASGKSVLAFEEPAKVTESKDDFFVDKSLYPLPAGAHRGVFGLARNGAPVALVPVQMTLAGSLDKNATAVSPLILSNNVYPLPEAQKADDPFAFGGVRVIPKADKTFRSSDELWYFFEMRNPGLAEPTLPEGQVPVNPAAVAQMPKVQLKLDVEGTDATGKKVKMSAPPRETDAIEMKGVPGHYGVGNAIPLASFKPGDYTFTVKVIDTVRKASYTLSDKFKVVE